VYIGILPSGPNPSALSNAMRMLSTLAYWEGLILFGGFLGVVLWKLLTGGICLDQLLEGDLLDPNKPEGYSTYVSAGRTQSLAFTLFVAGYYLLQLIHNPKQFPTLPIGLVGALAGSHALFLGGKARALLRNRPENLSDRRKP
jgi:hypothetical protein